MFLGPIVVNAFDLAGGGIEAVQLEVLREDVNAAVAHGGRGARAVAAAIVSRAVIAGAEVRLTNTATGVAVSGETIHTVKSGETLLKIAGRYGTKVAAIKSLNGLTTDQIKVGQKLKIPVKAVAPAPAPHVRLGAGLVRP